tara:strand:- start:133 stop:333 length:201 start_codon:yes stop_codon:yes gene_type:complete
MSIYKTNKEARAKIDGYLLNNAKTQAGLGIESDKFERYLAKEYWLCMVDCIREIDPEFADIVEPEG